MKTTKILYPGTVLYLGHNTLTSSCPAQFLYSGQNANNNKSFRHFVGYYTTNEATAEGYARCFQGSRGWVNKYIVREPIGLVDVTDEFTHYEPDEVEQLFCPGGYYIQWAPGIDEISLCDPWNYLEYVGSKPCLSVGYFGQYTCRKAQATSIRKRKIKQRSKNHKLKKRKL
jgi:hypothetical protein